MILVALSLELRDFRFFLNRFPVCFNLFVLLFLVTSCLVVAVQPCMEWISIKKSSNKYTARCLFVSFLYFHNNIGHFQHVTFVPSRQSYTCLISAIKTWIFRTCRVTSDHIALMLQFLTLPVPIPDEERKLT